ncbi:MAG: asparagine synthase-related protein [Bacteroidales bacterium]
MIIKQPSLSFYNKRTAKIQADIWGELRTGLWRFYSIENQIANNSFGPKDLIQWKPVFDDIVPVYPGTKWNIDQNKLEEDRFNPNANKITKDGFYAASETFFAQYREKNIAVHLSGGLDSSIIIGLLKYHNIPFSLIGLSSSRFEFRTERRIQDILSKFGANVFLIDLDDYPSYSQLSQIHPHQIPDAYIRDNQASLAMAEACRRLGIEVCFSGQGGDTIFADAIPSLPNTWSCNISNEFRNPWYEDILYPSCNVVLVSFYADKGIIEALYNLRVGQGADVQKKWARKYFKHILPNELVNYTYCADFFGVSLNGLHKARPEIEALFKKAYELVGHPVFSPSEIKKMQEMDFFTLEYKTYIDLCSRISIAVWYNSLLQGGIIM